VTLASGPRANLRGERRTAPKGESWRASQCLPTEENRRGDNISTGPTRKKGGKFQGGVRRKRRGFGSPRQLLKEGLPIHKKLPGRKKGGPVVKKKKKRERHEVEEPPPAQKTQGPAVQWWSPHTFGQKKRKLGGAWARTGNRSRRHRGGGGGDHPAVGLIKRPEGGEGVRELHV